jgi:hypothetical protein
VALVAATLMLAGTVITGAVAVMIVTVNMPVPVSPKVASLPVQVTVVFPIGNTVAFAAGAETTVVVVGGVPSCAVHVVATGAPAAHVGVNIAVPPLAVVLPPVTVSVDVKIRGTP